MVERNYELRKLCADDIFPMVNIISKIGIENMADCFDAKEMADIMNSVDSTLDEEEAEEYVVMLEKYHSAGWDIIYKEGCES